MKAMDATNARVLGKKSNDIADSLLAIPERATTKVPGAGIVGLTERKSRGLWRVLDTLSGVISFFDEITEPSIPLPKTVKRPTAKPGDSRHAVRATRSKSVRLPRLNGRRRR